MTSGTRFPLEGVREVHDYHNLNRPPSILPNNADLLESHFWTEMREICQGGALDGAPCLRVFL